MILFDKEGREIYIQEKKCPLCGNNVWSYADPRHDSTLGTYCISDNCNFTENQYMTYEEIIKVEKN